MRKFNFLWLMVCLVLFGACESEYEKDLSGTGAEMKGGVSILPLLKTRADVAPFFSVGDKVGIFAEYNGQYSGPHELTIASYMGGTTLVEPLPFINYSREHTYYAYIPYASNASPDPKQVGVTPILKQQTQVGVSDAHVRDYEYNVAEPVDAYPYDPVSFLFTSTYSIIEFQINSNVNGIVVNNIHVKAPDGKEINFTSADMDITKKSYDPDFARNFNITGATSETNLEITGGGLSIPNSEVTFAPAYMVINPFKCTGEKLIITVTTEKDGTFTFEKDGESYDYGSRAIIPLRIEKKILPVARDFRILSVCEVGCLGEYTNNDTKCYYGATAHPVHAKAIRRLIHEHFGKGKTVETGTIYFDKLHGNLDCYIDKLTRAEMEKYNIIYMNNNTRMNARVARDLTSWLEASDDRVLMLAFDWKDHAITKASSDKDVLCKITTNYLMFKNHITGVEPHWYNGKTNYTVGNYGSRRDDMLVPFELNERTRYFWKDGPFKTNLTESSDQRYWIEDDYWGCAQVSDPNVIPLITYRDARNDCKPGNIHKDGAGDGGMILGVDPVKRIVYIGDSEIFSIEGVCSGAKQDARMVYKDCGKAVEMNNYTKIMGNLWAWMINEVVQKP